MFALLAAAAAGAALLLLGSRKRASGVDLSPGDHVQVTFRVTRTDGTPITQAEWLQTAQSPQAMAALAAQLYPAGSGYVPVQITAAPVAGTASVKLQSQRVQTYKPRVFTLGVYTFTDIAAREVEDD